MNTSASPAPAGRRDFMRAAGTAALTTSIFTGKVKGANDRVSMGFIGMGTMGMGNLGYAVKTGAIQPVAVCDVWQPHLERAQARARKEGFEAKAVADFREILADRSIDAVCISTPDHWHAYMTVEACKAGKDVYVEKPACVWVEEGVKMVAAARKYNRVVQAGTMQRSGGYFKKAAEMVGAGELGEITFCRTWQGGMPDPTGQGNPPDGPVPAGLDWEMWLGPAPKRPFNPNRWGIAPKRWSTFRYYWDYAGGAMTDWGVHLLDIVQMAFKEAMPKSIAAFGDRFFVKDSMETPDTMLAEFHYPGFLATYESRTCNPYPLYDQNYGTAFHGTKGTLVVNRGGYWYYPVEKGAAPVVETSAELRPMNDPHWANFVECVRTRQKPQSEIETCVRTTWTCLLANISMRYGMRLDWDERNGNVRQSEARQHLKLRYRSPWKLEV